LSDCLEERLDLAELAALVWGGLIEQPMFGFLLGDGPLGEQVDEIQLPLPRDAVAVRVSLREVIAGVKEENRDFRIELDCELREEHVFCLKTAGETSAVVGGEFAGQHGADLCDFGLDERCGCSCAHQETALLEDDRMPACANSL
jgi:hypothetical protein